MDNSLIAYCGEDCAACPDLRDNKCPGCRGTEWSGADICMPVRCCREKSIPFCGKCADFPCAEMRKFYGESEGHKRACELMLALRDADI